jgi:large subunit ribosomal protein L20
MPRSKNKVASHRRRKKLLQRAKGFVAAGSKVYTVAKHKVDKGLGYAYRDRRAKKRLFRQLWITRINAAARIHGVSYSQLIHGLDKKSISINRKVLADLAVNDGNAFAEILRYAVQ